MSDDTRLSANVGTGDLIKTLDDGTRKWCVGVPGMVTTVGDPDTITVPVGAALADNTSNPTVYLHGSCVLWFDGTTWDRARGDSTDGLLVNLGTNNDVTITSGTITTVSTVTAVSDAQVQGKAAHDAAVSGNPVLVGGYASTSLPNAVTAGDAARLWLTLNGAVQIADGEGSITVDTALGNLSCDIASVVPSTGPTNLGKAEDSVHATGNVGVFALAVRSDTAANTAGTDGDYCGLITDSTGRLWCNVSNTVTVAAHAVTNAGTFAVQVDGAALTALQLIDDPVFTDDAAFTPATSKVMMAGYEYDDTTPDSVDEGDAGAARMSANRCQYVMIRDNAGNERGLNVDTSGNITVNVTGTVTVGSHAVTNAGTFAVQVDGAALTALQLIDDAVSGSGFNISQMNGVAVTMGNGASGTGVQRVTIANDSTGILAGVTTVTTVTTCSTLTGGGVAHDGADSGNPHKIGAKATTSLSGKTMVVDNDRTDLFAGTDGVLIVRPHTNLEDVVQERTTNTDGASTAFASGLAAPGAGVRLWITSIDIANSSASFCTVDLRDGAAGAVLWTLPVPATGGVCKQFNPPLRLTANTALAFDASAAITTLSISANGFKSKV